MKSYWTARDGDVARACLPWLGRLLDGEAQAAGELPPREALLRFAQRNRLESLLLARLDGRSSRATLPSEVRQRWSAAASRQWLTNQYLAVQLRLLSRRFLETGRSFVVLKGEPLAEELWGSREDRPSSDLDLLVPAASAEDCLRWLHRELGFTRPIPLRAVVRRVTKAEFLVRRGLVLDLHWRLHTLGASELATRRLQETAVPWTLEDRGGALEVRVPAREYALVKALLGLHQDLPRRLDVKTCIDAYLLARSLDRSGDWWAFFERRREERLHRIAADLLRMVLELFDAEDRLPGLSALPPTVLPPRSRSLPAALRPSGWLRALWRVYAPLCPGGRGAAFARALAVAPVNAILIRGGRSLARRSASSSSRRASTDWV